MPQRPDPPTPPPDAADPATAGNELFAQALVAMPSPSGAPTGMSRQELAEAVNAELDRRGTQGFLTDKDIGRFWRGETRWPRDHYRAALRTVLGVKSDRELGFYRNRNRKRRLAAATPEADDGAFNEQLPVPVGDRLFETALASYEGRDSQPSQPSLARLRELSKISIQKPFPTTINWSDVEHVRFITRMFAMSENAFGGGLSGEAAAAQLRHSASLVEARAINDVRRAMFEAVGNLSEVVGFSAFDVGDYASAYRCFDFSLWCAHQGKSWSLRASALADMARMATYLGRTDNALSLIEFAQVRSDRIPATARAMLSAVRARLLALQGRYSDARAEVDRSDGYFAERNAAEDPPWLCYYDQAEHEGSTGRALIPIAVSIDDPGLVVPRLETAVRLQDAHHPRSREFSRTRLASLLMRIGDVKEAAALGRTVLAESASLRSSRLHSEIRQLGRLAANHDHIPEVAELRQGVIVLTATDGA